MDDLKFACAAADAYTIPPMWSVGDVHAVKIGDVMSFPGTVPTNFENWIRDFDFRPSFHEHMGWCHHGFLSGGLALYPLVKDHIDEDTTLAGHSLGGALAIVVAAKSILDGVIPAGLVTFGAPRAGFHTLVELISVISYLKQFHDGNDPVVDAPPGYLHMREPLIHVGVNHLDPIEAHFIAQYEKALSV